MNKDQRLLEEAYQSIYESIREPEYFGPSHVRQDFLNWLYRQDFEVHEDGSVSIDGDVTFMVNERGNRDAFDNIGRHVVDRLPFNFRKVTRYFWCPPRLRSLEGSPKYVGKDFNCPKARLTSLHGAPESVGGDFYCSDLLSLEGAPKEIKGEFINSKFSDEDYRTFAKKRKYVDNKLDKDLNVDLGDFS